MLSATRKKLVTIAVGGFCLLMLVDWTGLTRWGFPSSWPQAVLEVCVNILWTVLFTVVSYFVMIRPRGGPSREEGGRGPEQASAQESSKSDPRGDAER